MELRLDGKLVQAQPGQSLLQMVQQLGLDDEGLSRRPLAAKIAGEVFTLNYIPLREKDKERTGVRAAVAASGGDVKLLRYTDAAGKELYLRTAQFIIFLALRRLWPQVKAKIHCTIGAGMMIEMEKSGDFSLEKLELEIRSIIASDIPFGKKGALSKRSMSGPSRGPVSAQRLFSPLYTISLPPHLLIFLPPFSSL